MTLSDPEIVKYQKSVIPVLGFTRRAGPCEKSPVATYKMKVSITRDLKAPLYSTLITSPHRAHCTLKEFILSGLGNPPGAHPPNAFFN